MAQAENTRRWIVRTALVTSSTIATLVGAQMLITVDQTANAAQPQTAVVQTSRQYDDHARSTEYRRGATIR